MAQGTEPLPEVPKALGLDPGPDIKPGIFSSKEHTRGIERMQQWIQVPWVLLKYCMIDQDAPSVHDRCDPGQQISDVTVSGHKVALTP